MPVIATTYALAGRAERLLVVHIHNLAAVGSDRQLDHTYTRGLYLVAGSVRVFENSNRLSDHRAVVFELAVAP